MIDINTQINKLSESIQRKLKKAFGPPTKPKSKPKPKPKPGMFNLSVGKSRTLRSVTGKKGKGKKENFSNLESGLQNTIISQNQLIDQQTNEFYRNINTMNQRYNYQTKMFHNLEFLNFGLIFVYTVIFILVKVLILEQYYKQTVVRDEWTDSIILTLFFLYPFLIYSVEMYLYDFVMMIVAYFYGMSRVPEFDDLLTGTDFYKNPGPNASDSRDTRNKFA